MKSLVMNQRAFQAEVFFAYSRNRGYGNGFVEASITPHKFRWEYKTPTTNEDGKKINKLVVSLEMLRDEKHFSSTEAKDIVDRLDYHWGDFMSRVLNDDKEPGTQEDKNPLSCPSKHSLQAIFEELKFGRPADSQKFLDKCIQELESDEVERDEYFYEPFYQYKEGTTDGRDHCFGLRWTEDHEQMPVTYYGKTVDEAWEGFMKELNQSAFRVVMIDIDALVKKDCNCGMNYCDENGCVDRKRVLTDPVDPQPEK